MIGVSYAEVDLEQASAEMDRDALVLASQRLVASRVQKLSGQVAEDLVQAGVLGLLRAAQTWDPQRGRWSTYAVWWVDKRVREARDRLRGAESPLVADACAEGAHGVDLLLAHSRARAARAAISALPAEERQAVELLHGFSGQPPMGAVAAGRLLGCATREVRRRAARAKARLLRMMGEDAEGDSRSPPR